MPRTNKQGNMVMTEDEAKEKLQSMGLSPPNSNPKNQNQNKSSPQSSPKASGQRQGWWNEPLRHSLSSRGIQTAMSGKQEMDDLGSVYYPSDRYKDSLKDVYGEIEAESLKEILKRLYKDPTLYERLDEEVQSWIQKKIGHIYKRRESQENRNQLDNGNFKIPKKDYELLKEFENGIRDDISSVQQWYEELESDYENKLNEAEQKLDDYESQVKSKTDKPEKYRKAVNEKLSDYQFKLQQLKADMKYAEYIHSTLEKTHSNVKELYNNAKIDNPDSNSNKGGIL